MFNAFLLMMVLGVTPAQSPRHSPVPVIQAPLKPVSTPHRVRVTIAKRKLPAAQRLSRREMRAAARVTRPDVQKYPTVKKAL